MSRKRQKQSHPTEESETKAESASTPNDEATTPNQAKKPFDKDLKKGKWQRDHKARKRDEFTISHTTVRKPIWNYLSLLFIGQPDADILTVKRHLTAAQTRFLGLVGSSMSIDILHLDQPPTAPGSAPVKSTGEEMEISPPSFPPRGTRVLIRTYREDCAAIMAAVGGYVGFESGSEVSFRVLGRGGWVGALMGTVDEEALWK